MLFTYAYLKLAEVYTLISSVVNQLFYKLSVDLMKKVVAIAIYIDFVPDSSINHVGFCVISLLDSWQYLADR